MSSKKRAEERGLAWQQVNNNPGKKPGLSHPHPCLALNESQIQPDINLSTPALYTASKMSLLLQTKFILSFPFTGKPHHEDEDNVQNHGWGYGAKWAQILSRWDKNHMRAHTACTASPGNSVICQDAGKWIFTVFQNFLLHNKEWELCGKPWGATPTCRHLTPHSLALPRGGERQTTQSNGLSFLIWPKSRKNLNYWNSLDLIYQPGSAVSPSSPAARMNEQQGSGGFKDLGGKYWWIKSIRTHPV